MKSFTWNDEGRKFCLDLDGALFELDESDAGPQSGEIPGFVARGVFTLAARAQDLEAVLTDRELEIRLLRRERRLLIDMDKARATAIQGLLNRTILKSNLTEIERIQAAVLALHIEARGGVLLPEGAPCQCLLCAPKRNLQPAGVAWSHQDDPQSFGAVLPCGNPDCRQPNCPTAGENHRRAIDNKAGLLHGDPEAMAAGDIAGFCETCDGPVYHRPGHPGEYDHACAEPAMRKEN